MIDEEIHNSTGCAYGRETNKKLMDHIIIYTEAMAQQKEVIKELIKTITDIKIFIEKISSTIVRTALILVVMLAGILFYSFSGVSQQKETENILKILKKELVKLHGLEPETE